MRLYDDEPETPVADGNGDADGDGGDEPAGATA